MKRFLLLVVAVPVLLSTACAPGMYSGRMMPGPFVSRPMYQPRPVAESPVGRWDNVMMLAAGTPLKVLTLDGAVTTGTFVGADNMTLRYTSASRDVAVASADVMRVDRLPGLPAGGVMREGVRGAAIGAGAVGVLGLLTGHLPPARVFVAGSALGAYEQAGSASMMAGPGIVYLAESVAPRHAPVAQSIPRSVPR